MTQEKKLKKISDEYKGIMIFFLLSLYRSVHRDMDEITWSNNNLNKGEAAARGTQIKSILGVKDFSPISAEHLKYMKDTFVELTGQENSLQAFLDSITDFEDAAEWLSRNAYSLGTAFNLLNYDFLKHPFGGYGF